MVGKLLLSTSRSTDGSGSPEMLAARNKKEEPRFYREKKGYDGVIQKRWADKACWLLGFSSVLLKGWSTTEWLMSWNSSTTD